MDIVARQAEFAVLAQALEDELSPAERDLLGRAMRARPKSTRTYGFEDLGAAVHVPLGAIAALDPPRARAVSRALIAGLCASNAAELGQGLGPRVGVRIDDALTRLLPWLDRETPPGYSFPEDLFLKDYRFATGMTLPCGAQVVDLAERPGVKTAIALAARHPAIAWACLARPWLRPHTETRYLDEFNEHGWNVCFAEMAAMLERLPRVAGMIATSWFYDPVVSEISPRLAYLRRVPMENGAVAVSHGTTQFDIDSATATSPTRRAMYEDGTYLPQCWSILWPRAAMLAWSRSEAGRAAVRSGA